MCLITSTILLFIYVGLKNARSLDLHLFGVVMVFRAHPALLKVNFLLQPLQTQ